MSDSGLLTADNPTEAPATSWTESVTEEFRGGVSKFGDINALAKGYTELESSMGSRIKMPGDDATDEERGAFYQKLGRPDEATGYSRPELTEGQTFDEDFMAKMSAVAHQNGVSDKQFGKFIEETLIIQGQAEEAKVQAENMEAETTQAELHKEWAGDYDKNLEMSKRALRELVPADMSESFVSIMTEKNLDNNITFIKAFQAIGAQMLDDTLVKGTLPKGKEGYVPSNQNSPEMYAFGDSEECVNARAYFESKGHKY
jgi:hypothetical protein